MEVCYLRACVGETPEIFGEGDMRQVALEVRLILFTIIGMVQESIVIVEDVPFGDGVIAIVAFGTPSTPNR